MSDTKNLFISHVHEDDAELHKLKALLEKAGYVIRNGSIDKSKFNEARDEDYIKSGILAPRIQWAGALVVLVSPETHLSRWVEWEIEYAQKEGKRIVGVWCQGAKDSDLPPALEKYADALVGWQAEPIISAVEGRLSSWYSPDGSERQPKKISHYSCA
jgi:hypothetical protein